MKTDRTLTKRDTCGMADPKLDHFTDVKRALHAHLMRTEPIYRKASQDSKLRNERRKSGFTSAGDR